MELFHEGERAVQSRAGVDTRELGRGISREISSPVATFVAGQRIAILAGLDSRGHVWASPLIGRPGFITAPDPATLRLDAGLPPADPLGDALTPGAPLGVLVIDLERRRRLRINGRVSEATPHRIEVRAEEVFGNCPKYIQARATEDAAGHARSETARRSVTLTETQHRVVAGADTFFIASVHAGRGADASHRGGPAGFVRVVDERRLRVPDYAGNNMFQTLGNVASDPRVGLLFVDFVTGTTLQLTGRARIVWEREVLADLPGADRALDVELDEVVEIAGREPLGWRLLGYSPFNPH